MSDRHLAHWPPGLPCHLALPQTHLFHNAEVSAARYPDKPFLVFYDTLVTFRQFQEQAEHIAGFLQQVCGVKAGDRVLLYMQNSPQWILAFYGILRANAVVVPVNPMNRTDELRHYVHDSGATVAFVPQDLHAQAQRQADHAGAEREHPLDRIVRLAGVGRPQHRRYRPGARERGKRGLSGDVHGVPFG